MISRTAAISVSSLLLVIGFITPNTTFAWIDANYSNIGNIYGGTIYGYGGAMATPVGMPYAMPNYAPYGGGYGGSGYSNAYQAGSFGFTSGTGYARVFDPMHDTFPPYPQQSFGTVWYPNQPYSQYGIGGSSYPSFGPSYVTGDYDLLGTPLCQWYDYSGRTPCAYDPHQWVYDQYTGGWY